MAIVIVNLRVIVGALAMLVMAVDTQPLSAKQPNSVNPQASAVKEDQLLQQLQRIQAAVPSPGLEILHGRTASRT